MGSSCSVIRTPCNMAVESPRSGLGPGRHWRLPPGRGHRHRGVPRREKLLHRQSLKMEDFEI